MEKDLELLKKYEGWFHSAVYADYMRALWENDLKILVQVYEKWTNKKVGTNFTCGRCKLNFVKTLGKLYFKNKEEYESKSKQTERESNSNEGESTRQTDSSRTSVVGQKSKRGGKTSCKGSKSKTDKGTKK